LSGEIKTERLKSTTSRTIRRSNNLAAQNESLIREFKREYERIIVRSEEEMPLPPGRVKKLTAITQKGYTEGLFSAIPSRNAFLFGGVPRK